MCFRLGVWALCGVVLCFARVSVLLMLCLLSHGFLMFGGWLYLGLGVGARLQCMYDL